MPSFPVSAGWRFYANASYPAAMLELGEVQATARPLGIEVAAPEIRRAEDIGPAFEGLKGRAEAIYVAPDPLVFSQSELKSAPWR